MRTAYNRGTMMNKEALGKRINAARRDLGITSEKLAEMCNINATYLRQIESGRKMPSLPVFITLYQQLRVTPTFLLWDTLAENENGDVDALIRLLQNATPNQIKLITAMITTALDALPE